ncbi:hypothetical protein NDU88_000449 [Pleurodeles waltl]|uniref:Uncharacterized protein n=1 Tax=Pleurodeles waltl TaxID=8319 RepID=A0AAV7TF02_PLEWA|nr:hypothetical protein NDU88_000449 [Pleurodeles waltl]
MPVRAVPGPEEPPGANGAAAFPAPSVPGRAARSEPRSEPSQAARPKPAPILLRPPPPRQHWLSPPT